MKPVISILTPTWNRATYLTKVWESLMNQSCRDFEWIVANDGSDDETVQSVKHFASRSKFPVILINASCHIGKSRMDNEAVAYARGEFVLWCDSDDYLMPDALEVLKNAWNSIPFDEKDTFCGVTALCDTATGIVGSDYPRSKFTDIQFNELLNTIQSDLVIFTRSELLKSTPFLEVDFLIPETSVWNSIGVRKTRFIPQVLQRKRYGESHCLSFSGLMEFNRGRAFAMVASNPYLVHISTPIVRRIWKLINYFRYCIHGEISIKEALRMWGTARGNLASALIVLPLSFLLAIKDEIQGTVRKTHRNFIDADKVVKISVQYLNDANP